MDDRYLFKAKRIDNGEWVQGNILLDIEKNKPSETYRIYPIDHVDICRVVDETTICQCTGLEDKNGKLIWENDVTYMRCNGLSGYGNVIYENGCFWIDDKKRGRKYPFSNHDVKYRVDGNIFDNTELLESEG